MNEKFAPELLESKSEIVECVMEQLEHMVLNWGRGGYCIMIHCLDHLGNDDDQGGVMAQRQSMCLMCRRSQVRCQPSPVKGFKSWGNALKS